MFQRTSTTRPVDASRRMERRLLRGYSHVCLAPLFALALLGCAGSSTPRDGASDRVAWVGGTIIAGPGEPAIADGVVIVEGNRIAFVGSRTDISLAGARVVDCRGTTILAAFWNTHVHFTQPVWRQSATAPAAQLDQALADMLLRWGFAFVVDLGSDIDTTSALRDRIRRGQVRGPVIRTAGSPFVARDGQPAYVPVSLPQLVDVPSARRAVSAELDAGADLVKLMTASVVEHPPAPVMPLEIVRAVVAVAHARDALVVAHPTNHAGVEVARAGGVDILAHTAPAGGPWSSADARALVAANIALVPTLALWRLEIEEHDAALADRYEQGALQQVRTFAAAGGELLFGTDVGYRPETDPTAEHVLLARAGLPFDLRLAMLTTTPARRFGAVRIGRLKPGWEAAFVVLDGDPRTDPRAWARVRCTVHSGRALWVAPKARCGASAKPPSPPPQTTR